LSLLAAVTNVIPGDYDHDGKLDLLVMYEEENRGKWWNGKEVRTGMAVYFGGGRKGAFRE